MWRRPGDLSERAGSRAAYGYAVILAFGLAYFLVRMPYQLSDDLEDILVLQYNSFSSLLAERVARDGAVRPVMWLQQKVLFDLPHGGRYFAAYKAFHVAQLVLLIVLFVRLLRIRTAIDLAALPLTLAALVGMHTFNVTMREGYPVNHFMTVLVCCLLAANLALSRQRWWRDVAAVVVLAYAVFTIESGVLVWVCTVAAYAAGWRGVSWKGVAAATAVLAAYFVVRVGILDVGGRTLMSMSSGYGFSIRGTGELNELFGDAPWKFYLYNVVSAVATVLFSEPRAGVFRFTSFIVGGEIPPWSIVNVVVSTIGTVFIGIHVVRRIRHVGRVLFLRPAVRQFFRAGALEHGDGLLLLFLALLGANAVITYPYLKEVVMSPAGMFYAAALFVATRDVLSRFTLSLHRGAMALLVAIPLLVLSAGWTLRAVALVESLRASAFVNRSDWATAEEYEDENRPEWRTRHPDAERVLRALRDEVIRMPVPQPYMAPPWTRRWLDPY